MRGLAHFYAWLDGRTPRERIMLIVCAALLAAVLCWMGIYRPLESWRETAADARFAAQAERGVVAGAVAASISSERPAAPDDITAAVQQSASALGLAPNLAMAVNGDLGFTLSNVAVGVAFAWLADLEQRGLAVTALSVVENADSTVTVEGAISRGR